MTAIAFDYSPDPHGEERFMFGERHSCRDEPRCVYPYRGCAQARVEHDGGDEQPGEWSEAHGRWLVGGGRYSEGTMGPLAWGDWSDRWCGSFAVVSENANSEFRFGTIGTVGYLKNRLLAGFRLVESERGVDARRTELIEAIEDLPDVTKLRLLPEEDRKPVEDRLPYCSDWQPA